ncbi:hypothetical protein BZA05DRAFT_441636 [Tricharina praecox]|uniref:uncharacterized protein n=1 Tax=Tricharina praecox TaxID=43433 RepID=UPI00221F8E3E|nr:uncharacterized protein BZA05DRAFT_441636 [Tricharina praecox]KAI5857004.1 hypothetical protein BZA05DRAFT_441636 [Tricharina praecox]
MAPRTLLTFNDALIARILQYLPTASLFTASVVCSRFRRLLFSSGYVSQALLKPHLAVLRSRFGPATVPRKLAISAVRQLLSLYARQALFGEFSSTVTYDVSDLCCAAATWRDACAVPLRTRRFAVSASLLAYAVKNRRVHVFDTRRTPVRLLTTLKLRARAVALAVSEAFLAVLDETGVHMYQLLARDTPKFMPVHTYSITIPGLKDPCAIAITPERNSTPLVAVLGAELVLVHPSHALAERRGRFFRPEAAAAPLHSEKQKARASVSSKSKSQPRKHEWILTSPGLSINLSPPLSFSMSGRQLSVSAQGHSAFLGAAWSNEDSHELARRRINGLKDGAAAGAADQQSDDDAELLFKHFRGARRWVPKHLNTGGGGGGEGAGGVQVTDAMHIWDSYYILTERESGAVRIATVAPYEPRCTLYRRPQSRGDANAGYAVWSQIVDGRTVAGYIAFSPAEGRLNVLPLERIPWTGGRGGRGRGREDVDVDVGWELVTTCRDIAIGSGEILGMSAGSEQVVVVFEDRVVVVRLWVREVGGVGDERCEWAVDRKGGVHRDWEGRGKLNLKCLRSEEECLLM